MASKAGLSAAARQPDRGAGNDGAGAARRLFAFQPMVAHGVPGALDGQNERTRAMVDNIEASLAMLALVKPDIIVVAHTATSYYLGRQGEADLLARLQNATGIRVITAFGAVVRALQRLGVERVALGAPYAMETTLAGKRHLE